MADNESTTTETTEIPPEPRENRPYNEPPPPPEPTDSSTATYADVAGTASNPAGLDPHDFPPYTMNESEREASHGRLGHVDPASFAPEGSDLEDEYERAAPKPEQSVSDQADAARERNREAGTEGSGDDAVGDRIEGLQVPKDEIYGLRGTPESVEPSNSGDDSGGDGDSRTVAELKQHLDSKGVEYDPRAKKAELSDLANQNP